MTGSAITDNTGGSGSGGGIYLVTAELVMVDSTVSGNDGGALGGGILVAGSSSRVALANTTISDNHVTTSGGGIGVISGDNDVTLTNVTIFGNSATLRGGGVTVEASSNDLIFTNTTMSGNFADIGGGVHTGASSVNVTFANSIVAGNSATTTGNNVDILFAPTYDGGNIIGDTLYDEEVTVATGIALTDIFASVVTVDPDGPGGPGVPFDAGELGDNGGPVETIAIARSGPAHNTGDNAALFPDQLDQDKDNDNDEPLPFDARGEDRIANGLVDLGAIELVNAEPVAADDMFSTDEATIVNGDLTADNGNGADDDPDPDALSVTMINGAAFIPGVASALTSGALLTVNADGTFTYDPNDVFDFLPVGDIDQDSFTYTVEDGFGGSDSATVTIEIIGLDSDDLIIGTPGKDNLAGGIGNDTIIGLKSKDRLDGEDGNDILEGRKGKDTLLGGAGDDILAGGQKKDKLKGEDGADTFVFHTKLGKKNVDKVKDFEINQDVLFLDKDVFKKVGNKLSKKEFEIGSKADDGKDRIIYQKSTGNLYYDKDGKGGKDQVKFAKLDKGLKLDRKDFEVGDFVV